MFLLFDFNARTVEGNNFSLQLTITGTTILKWPFKIFIISRRNSSKLRNTHKDKLIIVPAVEMITEHDKKRLCCGDLTGTF